MSMCLLFHEFAFERHAMCNMKIWNIITGGGGGGVMGVGMGGVIGA